MNLYHLRYFVTLAHMEHYTRAADLLAITQPSLSHAISSLESELGVKLFKKNGRNVTLTKYGKSFLTDAEDILQKLDSSVGNLQLAGKGEGRIDIAFLRTLGSDFVPRILRRFLDENQGKQIDFTLHCDKVITDEILKGLKEQKYDIGFCSKINDEPLIEFIPVAKQDLVVIVPLDHPLASKSEIHLEETLEYKQIIYKSGSGLRHIIDHLFDQIGAYPDASYEIAEDHVVAGFVANGFGIAVAPDIPIIHSLNLKVLPLVSPTWQRNFYMATLKDAYHPPVVDIFKQFVIEQTRGDLDYRTI
ncbi:LysR family transcriptional regulator [Blautia sp.]